MESAVFLDPEIEKLPCSPFRFDFLEGDFERSQPLLRRRMGLNQPLSLPTLLSLNAFQPLPHPLDRRQVIPCPCHEICAHVIGL